MVALDLVQVNDRLSNLARERLAQEEHDSIVAERRRTRVVAG